MKMMKQLPSNREYNPHIVETLERPWRIDIEVYLIDLEYTFNSLSKTSTAIQCASVAHTRYYLVPNSWGILL
jgi:hypothetical protein